MITPFPMKGAAAIVTAYPRWKAATDLAPTRSIAISALTAY